MPGEDKLKTLQNSKIVNLYTSSPIRVGVRYSAIGIPTGKKQEKLKATILEALIFIRTHT